MSERTGETSTFPSDGRPLALTMGDPAGIGLDIVIGAWSDRARWPLPAFVLYADPVALTARAALLGAELEIAILDDVSPNAVLPPASLPVIPIRATASVVPGKPEPANAQAVIASIERAVADTMAGHVSGVVTNPISKETLYAAGFQHPGHTEFLGVLAGQHRPGYRYVPVMMLASDELRVVPLTVHIPLAAVPAAVTAAKLIETVRITARDLTSSFGIAKPRLAVAGLNPHAGEGGSLGREEIEVIAPAIAVLAAEGYAVTGPHSADTLFHAAARALYDVAVCMYHDQALIPIKTLAFDTGVNVTLGLPFVRTSPDHGTAFDIAGTGRAKSDSLIAALRMGHRMAAARAGHSE